MCGLFIKWRFFDFFLFEVVDGHIEVLVLLVEIEFEYSVDWCGILECLCDIGGFVDGSSIFF